MQTLKKFFPLSFKFVKDGGNLAVGIIIYIGISIGVSVLMTILGFIGGFILGLIPAIGIVLAGLWGTVLGMVSTVASLYCLAGIVFQILVFTKVFTDPDAPIEVEAVDVETVENNGTDAE